MDGVFQDEFRDDSKFSAFLFCRATIPSFLYSLYVSTLSMCECMSHMQLSRDTVLTTDDKYPLRGMFPPALGGHNNRFETFMTLYGIKSAYI
jgi:hypothetical protein